MHPSLKTIFVRFVALLAIIAIRFPASGQFVRGIVRDSVTTAGIPYASITFDGTRERLVADSRGIFEGKMPAGATGITASSQGYARKTVRPGTNSFNIYDISLAPKATELKELVVKREKYSKKNNPAVEFVRRLRNSSSATDPRQEPYYSYNRYERISLGLHNFQFDSTAWLERHLPFLKNHIDTSAMTGAPVLTLSIKETASEISSRKEPHKEVELITGYRSEGIDEVVDQANMQTALADLFGEVDLFQPVVPLMQNRFISPLSAIAPDFYRFYLTDTVSIDSTRCVVLAFYPREKSSIGFTGHVYVSDEPGRELQIKRVDLHTARQIGVNFIDKLRISQTYTNASERRLKLTDVMEVVLEPVPGQAQLNVKRAMTFNNHSFEARPDSLFDTLGSRLEAADFSRRETTFWHTARTDSLTHGEESVGELMEELRRNKTFLWTERILSILFQGYVKTGYDSRFDIGPVNTFASYNSLEGLRLRAGGMTTANLNDHWFGRGYVAYGFRDHKWKYSVEAEYSFNAKKYHSREFPVNSIRLTHRYDVDRLGARYLTTNPDNFVLSWQRMPNRRYTYCRLTRLEYNLELANNLSFNIAAENQRQEATPYVSFRTFGGTELNHYTENIFGVTIRFAPGERFYQAKTYRYSVNNDAPVFTLSHRFASKGLGSRFGINKTELDFTKRFWLSMFGSVETAVGGGHVWGSTPFPELFIPNANLSYTIRPRSFALMNPMEFINSSYVSWDLTYQMRGLILGRIPGVKKLGLREVVGFRGLYGTLSERCRPSVSRPGLPVFPQDVNAGSMGKTPYMELSVGLENIFRVLRVDYVRRLTYRHPSYTIDRWGIRIALNLTF